MPKQLAKYRREREDIQNRIFELQILGSEMSEDQKKELSTLELELKHINLKITERQCFINNEKRRTDFVKI